MSVHNLKSMNKCLFNLYFSSSRSYKSNSNIPFIIFQTLSHFHIIIILDTIFYRYSLSSKPIYFPLYFLSPIFYLEYLLTQFNNHCINEQGDYSNHFKEVNQDRLSHIINYVFASNHSHLCNFDSYLLPISIMSAGIIIIFICVLILPASSNKIFFHISKILGLLIEFFFYPLLHIIFYMLTRKFLFLTIHVGEKIGLKASLWIILCLIILLCGTIYTQYTQSGNSILSYLIENNSEEIFLSFLSGVIINFRMLKERILFIYFLWIALFICKYYRMFIHRKYGLLFTLGKKVDFYIYSLFLCFAVVKFIICIIFWLSHFQIKSKNDEIVLQVIELGCTLVLYLTYFFKFEYYIKKKPTLKDMIYALKKDNEWGNFQLLFLVFIFKFVDFFQFHLFGEKKIKDREIMQEILKKRKELIKWFKESFIYNIKLEDIYDSSHDFEESEIEQNNDEEDNLKSKTSSDESEEDKEEQNLSTDEDKLFHKFKQSLGILQGYRQGYNSPHNKRDSYVTNNHQKDTNDFKLIIELVLNFRKMIKRYIENKFLNNHAKNEIFLFLIIVKLIFLCEYDNSTTRAEFYVKKYLRRKIGSTKFQILIKFLDIHFRKFAILTEDTFVQTMRMKDYSDQLLELIKKFQDLLEQFLLNGDSNQKRIEIIEKECLSIGKCYEGISKYNAMNINKFKLNENSTYVKLKIAQQLLFSPESPDKLLEETDIQFAEVEFTKSNYFILHFQQETIIVQRAPAKFLERTGFKGDELNGQELTFLLPKCFKATTYSHLRNQITKKGKTKFEEYEFFLTKNSYIVQAKLKFTVLPIIAEDSMVFADVDFNIKNTNNCFIINNKNEIVEIGSGLYTFMGLLPQVLPLSVSDVFDTEQPIQYKFLQNRHFHTINLDDGKATVAINIEKYIEIYKQLLKQHGIFEEKPSFIDNIQKYLDAHKIKDQKIIPILLSSSDTFKKIRINKNDNFRIFTFNFINISGISGHTLLGAMTLKAIGGADSLKTIDALSLGGVEMNLGLENKYTCCSTSSVSISTTSLTKVNALIGGKIGKHMRHNKHLNIPQILETAYGLMLIIIVIILVIVIKLLSQDLVEQFKVLRNVRLLNTIFFNAAFLVMNKMVYNNTEGYNSFEQSIINQYNEISEFNSIYVKEIRNISDRFFNLTSSTLTHMHNVLKQYEINDNIDISVRVIENDGNEIETTFLNAIEIPKLNLYQLSRSDTYHLVVGFYNKSKTNKENFSMMTNELEKVLYHTLVNFENILNCFIEVLNNVLNMFEHHYEHYQTKLYVIFCVSIFINLMSFFLYTFNSNQIKKKILKVANAFFRITKKDINYLSTKLIIIKKIIELEDHPSILLNKLNKQVQKKKIALKGQKSIQGTFNSQPTSTGSISDDKSHNSSIISTSGVELIDKLNSYNEQNEIKVNHKNRLYINNTRNNSKNKNNNKRLSLRVYNQVITAISFTHFLFILYACIVLPLLYKSMDNISMIQSFTKQIEDIQRVSFNYLITIQIYILTNKTDNVIESGFIDKYPSFYESIKIIQKFVESNKDLEKIGNYLNRLYGDELCKNTFEGSLYNIQKILVCESININKSSWTNILSHVIRNARNIFYNFHNSNRTLEDIGKYSHHIDVQELNLILFSFVNELCEYVKDRNGMVIFQQSIDTFVKHTIIMLIALIILEVINFIIITIKILRRLKLTLNEFKLIEKFFVG